ncbi:hypothetical protein EXIGLDRAFT_770824 [Exidia glandulosa HHB12029]|uniref:EF-hand domain-containing protein n=1 Tax=Exidia glandulosa HHB12029 TaxID=1314781 RepID=A0A165GEL5_EXIGL|nr:hypothetical protein EXIGLDRAFT_770824 [Exidia glandulosa HHB12029]
MSTAPTSRVQSPRPWSPRPETPEPGVQQGRRNASTGGAQLLDAEGNMSEQFEACLAHIFSKYCTPPPGATGGRLAEDAVMDGAALDKWACDTNGAPFGQETKDEMREYLDVNERGDLTYKGFIQIYALQTENDEEETWRDLSSHGFDRNLQLVPVRREDTEVDEGEPVPMSLLRGLGLGGSRVDSRESVA